MISLLHGSAYVLLAAAVGVSAASARATSDDGEERARPARVCFLPQTIRNYSTDGDATVYVRAGRGQTFEIQTGGCRGLMVSRSLGVTPHAGGSACVGEAITVATQGPSQRNENNSVCSARVMRALTAEEVAALPSRLRP